MFEGTKFTDIPLEERQVKLCCVCQTPYLPRSGINKFCSPSCKGKWKYLSGAETTEKQYEKISGNWSRYFARLVNQHQRKADGLTIDVLLEKLENQNYKCALSGIELTCLLEKGTIFKTNASIDRIEAGGPYVKENIQLVCRALNSWRTDTNLAEFIWWCKKVANFQEGKE